MIEDGSMSGTLRCVRGVRRLIAAVLVLCAGMSILGCQRDGRSNLLLITLDTTRADRLSCYGYSRPTSPNIDRLAEQSVLYTQAVATSSWTLPAHASLFTGKFTSSHGVRYDAQGGLVFVDPDKEKANLQRSTARGLSHDERTLAAILQEAGYSTGAVVGAPWLKRIFGLNRGFEHYDDSQIAPVSGRLASQVTPAVLEWLASREDKPWFLFVNYFDAHAPYEPPEPFKRAFLPKDWSEPDRELSREETNALYDGEIRFMDHHVGKLLDGLRAMDEFDDTLIVVTADHGEHLGEHGVYGHGRYLFEQTVRVPLLIKHPRGVRPAARSNVMVQTVDLFALLLHEAGLAIPDGIQGRVPAEASHPIIAEVYPLPDLSPHGHWRALYHDGYKFFWNSLGQHLLFNIARDPRESVNLFNRESNRAMQMAALLDLYIESLPPPGKPSEMEVDEETRELLRSLGYL